MANSKPRRLSKVAKELNVGISTIVEFLSDKGHDIDSSPNTKLDADVYGLLLDEFSQDKGAKEESKKIAINRPKKETITIEEKFETPEVEEEEVEEVKPVETPKVEAPKVEVKKEEPKKEEPAPAAEEEKVEEESNGGPKVVGKIDLTNVEVGRRKKKTKKEEPKAEPKTEAKAEKAAEEKKVEAPKAEEKPAAKEAAPEEKKPEPKKPEEVIKATADKINGPKVLGKIELPTTPSRKDKKKPVASSSESADKKKKRKRIRKDVVDVNKAGAANAAKGGTAANARNKKRKGREPKAELTEEEIAKQIKETLARLSGGSGKSKAAKYRKDKRDQASSKRKEEEDASELEKSILKVTEYISANEMASMMDVSVNEVISACMSLGLFVSINQRLDAETISIVAEEFGYEVEFVSVEISDAITEEEDAEEDLVTRPPIVTVMGHVDHGKTSLLDYVRRANVTEGEAGGITQHIGAYTVKLENGSVVSFLDTPGHEAFTAMRARGAQLTDICIIVIAADDNVMPQTKEAINHAQAAGVPMVFAINKIDKPGANPDKIKEELSQMNILVEDWGGKFQCQEISAKHGTNINELLEKVVLEAELLDLKANPGKKAVGTVVESSLDKGRGYVSNVLVQSGTLRVGDILVAGCFSGRVKAMFNERNQRVKEAGPSTPVLMLGLNGAPQAGDKFNVMEDEKEAREIAAKRLQLQREQGQRTQKHITLDEISRRLEVGDFKELNVIIKGDVDGSVEALSDSLLKLSTDQIHVNIIHKSVGQISESDVLLASASDAIVIGFQVRPSASARKLAEKEQIEIRLYSIIYDAIDEVKTAMEGMLAVKIEEKIVANVEVRDVFKITKVGTVAGCYVTEGTITRNTKIRLIRDGIVMYSGALGSLKRFKDDVKEVKHGYECGLNIEKYNDIRVGDVIEGYEEVEVKQTL